MKPPYPVYGKSPHLMFRLPMGRRLSNQGMANLRAALEDAFCRGKPLVLEDGIEVYQFVDNRWQPLTSKAGPTPGPVIASLAFSNGSWRRVEQSPGPDQAEANER